MWDGMNRRRFPRANYPCLIKITRKKPYSSISARTENIGHGGICVILKKDLGRFTPLDLELKLPDGKPPLETIARTVWVVKGHFPGEKPPKRYDTGIEFLELKDDDKERVDHIIEEILAGRLGSKK